MSAIDPERTVADLVVERPGRARVFEQLGIDYCCGGRSSLAAVCAERGLDPATVTAMLAAFEQVSGAEAGDDRDWSSAALGELCDHIVTEHHGFLRAELPRLEGLLERVVRAHGERHPEIVETAELFEAVAAELGTHMHVEEEVVFPLCRALDEGGVPEATELAGSASAMEHDHDVIGAALARMRDLTGGFAPPADACNTYRAALDGLVALERDLHRHIHEENNILFPRALALAGVAAA